MKTLLVSLIFAVLTLSASPAAYGQALDDDVLERRMISLAEQSRSASSLEGRMVGAQRFHQLLAEAIESPQVSEIARLNLMEQVCRAYIRYLDSVARQTGALSEFIGSPEAVRSVNLLETVMRMVQSTDIEPVYTTAPFPIQLVEEEMANNPDFEPFPIVSGMSPERIPNARIRAEYERLIAKNRLNHAEGRVRSIAVDLVKAMRSIVIKIVLEGETHSYITIIRASNLSPEVQAELGLDALQTFDVANVEFMAEYEISGTIEHEIRKGEKITAVTKADFKVFFRDGNWLIRTEEYDLEETDQWSEQPVVREIGTENGAELLEVISPRSRGSQEIPEQRRRNIGTIVTMPVPVGQLDNSVVGHLWLMFASSSYLAGMTNNLLTPVYDVSASAPGNPNLRRLVKWELLSGPGSLPREVIYLDQFGRRTDAEYRVTGTTNVVGMTFPTGFVFDTGRKRATATVESIRPECSLESLLPAITRLTIVADRRLNQAKEPVDGFAYQLDPGTTELPSVQEARDAYEERRNHPGSVR